MAVHSPAESSTRGRRHVGLPSGKGVAHPAAATTNGADSSPPRSSAPAPTAGNSPAPTGLTPWQPSGAASDADANQGSTVALAISDIRAHHHQSLEQWLGLYWRLHVVGSTAHTVRAKEQDFRRFLQFYKDVLGNVMVDDWTPAVTKAFTKSLENTLGARSGKPLSEATRARILATVRTFGRWLHKERPLLGGMPFAGIKVIESGKTAWAGLTSQQLTRLRSACYQRAQACTRQDQSPKLEAAVFYVLLHTGLREHELCALNLHQLAGRCFENVRRKGSRIDKKVPLPPEALEALTQYIDDVRGHDPGPLLVSRRGGRLSPRGVAYICARLSRQASVNLRDGQNPRYPQDGEKFHLRPHQLRHHFLKKVCDQHGIHYAQRMSGNVSTREIFRYAAPSDDEIQAAMDKLI